MTTAPTQLELEIDALRNLLGMMRELARDPEVEVHLRGMMNNIREMLILAWAMLGNTRRGEQEHERPPDGTPG
jgi:hypothetical protein